MNSHKLLVSTAMTAVLLLGLAAGLAAAQAPVDEAAPAGTEPAAVEAVLGTAAATPLSTSFTYQGQLMRNGTPANGTCDFRFTLYDAAASGSQVGSPVAKAALTVTGGLFTTDLDFGAGIFVGQKRWLQVEVSCPASGSPSYTVIGGRQELTATPYALYSAGNWALTGNAGTTPGTHYLGTSDSKALELKVNGARALRIEPNAESPNLIGGYSGNSVTGGALGAAIGGGGGATAGVNRVTDSFGTVGGGAANTAGDNAGLVDSSAYATVGGGQSNTASGADATVGGGNSNQAVGASATVGGGYANQALRDNATVGGGEGNYADGDYATVAGGMGNYVSAYAATVGGGGNNWAAAQFGTIAGGGSDDPATGNRVTDDYGSVGGGTNNQAGDNAGTAADQPYATVGGGEGNTASGILAAVGGGSGNTASGSAATVPGGANNDAIGVSSIVGGGSDNTASGNLSTIGGGLNNTASGATATVPGGQSNTASGAYSFAAGYGAKATHQGSFVWADSSGAVFASGAANQFAIRATGGVAMVVESGAWRIEPNAASPNLIGGYSGNSVTAGVYGATIGGGGASGETNRVTDDYGSVGGGANNQAGDNAGTTADRRGATVGGGYQNAAVSEYATVAGGIYNQASSQTATVGGGYQNSAMNESATVGGGSNNTASGYAAAVGGGEGNTASGIRATIGGGVSNTASGEGATVPGGYLNHALGDYSFAAGHNATANNQGCFVWGDNSPNGTVTCSTDNRWVARTSGGVVFWTNSGMTTGVTVAANGGSWSSASDRALKENFAPVDGQALLDQLAKMPVTTWNYKSQDAAIRHMGPVAQDFYAAFGVGEDDTHISTIDADGVALAASQALYRLAQEQASQISALQAQNAALEARLAALEARAAAGPAVGVVLTRPGGAQ